MTRAMSFAAATLVVAASLIAFSDRAAAHETRSVGPYVFVVGWLDEPAIQGQPNAATVRITDGRIKVFSGGLTTPFTGAMRAVFGQPGLYALDVIPTVSGGYKYQFTGKVESLDVNETFESGPGRFNDVQSAASLQFPEQVSSGAELARRLNEIQATADQARILAIVAVVIGLAAGGLILMRRRA